jgi:methylated-DNA-protein-cysteine methyltransferase-like protein
MQPERDSGAGLYAAIYDLVRQIPRGRVATYGQIAAIHGRCTPRMVGYAMAAVPHGSDVPWHRVLNSAGRSSLTGEGGEVQRALLAQEDIAFNDSGRVDLARYLWPGPGRVGKRAGRRGGR